ncbi:MAG: hypothetical protein GWM98_01030 [Nitrospinaceae bacterium]|nr:hypothetical protein [Nitrospinaceae bacterium]
MVVESYGTLQTKGWSFSKKRPPKNWFDPDHLKKVHARLNRVYIECLDFRKLIRIWDSRETFFYVDPPYMLASKDKLYHSFQFSEKDQKDLAATLGRISGKFLLSQPNDPEVKKLFRNFKISKTSPIRYSINKNIKKAEILIRNF